VTVSGGNDVDLHSPPLVTSTRNIWYLTLSMFFLRLGTATTAVALPLLVLERYGTGLGAGLSLGLRLVPNILFGPLIGNLVDRYDPRKIAVLSSIASGVVVGLFPQTTAIGEVMLLSVLAGVAYMFGYPARMALRARVLTDETRVKGNSMLVTSERLTSVIAPACAGPVIAFLGLTWLFRAEVVAAFIAAMLVLMLPQKRRSADPAVPPVASGEAEKALRSVFSRIAALFTNGLMEMVRIVRTDGMMLALTSTAFTYVAAVGVGVTFLSDFSLTRLHGVPGAYGYVVAAMGAGGVSGALLATRLGKFPPGWVYLLGNAVEGVLWVVFAATHWLAFGLPVIFLAGACESAATVVYFTEAQKRIPEEYTGRYYATFIPLTDICTMLGTTAGPLLVAGCGIYGTAIIIFGLITIPVLLFARPLIRPAEPPPRAL
jgi:MFS family permease